MPRLPFSFLRTLGLICLGEVMMYFFAAQAPPLIARARARVATMPATP